MVELAIRLVAAAGVWIAAGIWNRQNLDLAWRGAALFAAYSVVLHLLERRSLRGPNLSAWAAVIDAGLIAALVSAARSLDQFGFLVLFPLLHAVTVFRANAMAVAPITAAWLVLGQRWIVGESPSTPLLLQTAAVLFLGLLAHRLPKVTLQRKAVAEPIDPVIDQPFEPAHVPESLELRESFRQLQDRYEDLERATRRDRLAASLAEVRAADGQKRGTLVARKLKEWSGAEALAIYSCGADDPAFTLHASAGPIGDPILSSTVPRHRSRNDAVLKDRVNALLNTLHEGDAGPRKWATIPIKYLGKLVGLVTLCHAQPARLREAESRVADSGEIVGRLLAEVQMLESTGRRLRQAEMLYQVATVCAGADTPSNMLARIVRDLAETLDLDHIAAHLLDEGSYLTVAHDGAHIDFLSTMSFANGPGVAGWIETGLPELVIFDTAEDQRCSKPHNLRMRVGSFACLPLFADNQPFGFVTAATHRAGGLDSEQAAMLRMAVAEATQALGRLTSSETKPTGNATPAEFFHSISDEQGGHLVVVEIGSQDVLKEKFGRPAMLHASRELASRIRTQLPHQALMCRRAEGDILVWLRTDNEQQATRWASEIAAVAPRVPIVTPDGSRTVPIALRTRVAPFAQQTDRNSQEETPE